MRLWTAEWWFESTGGNRMDGLSVPSHGFKLLCGTANRALAEEMARHIGVDLARLTLDRFADGEIFVRIDENVRGNDVFIIQPTNPPAENIMELLLMIDAAKRASAARITVVMPYYGYSRQDRKDQPRVSIAAKVLANMIVTAGANRVLGLDFHQHQLQGFFDIPVDHLYAMPVFTSHYRKKQLGDEVAVVAPDVGSAKMARGFAKRLNASLAIIDKRRVKANVAEVMNVVGEVEGMDCILVDDMIDTASTVSKGATLLAQQGAGPIYAAATHPVLSGKAVQNLEEAPITEVVVTNTMPIPEEKRFGKLKVLSIAPLIADALRAVFEESSVSEIFHGENQ
jgi:ribose-phosphate pyrophosphokinase